MSVSAFVAQAVGDQMPGAEVILQANSITKSFGNVTALQDVSMYMRSGEITAIVGDNGAGKSTLIKCIAGVHAPDEGEIQIEGRPSRFSSPMEARRSGIETVYQNLALVDDLTIWQNLFLNREQVYRFGPFSFTARKEMRTAAGQMLARLEVNIPSINARVRRLSGGQRQAVAICRAAGWGSKIVIMDEPTAALGVRETRQVEELIRRLCDEGTAVLLISHNFDQVMRLSAQVWVMRSGRLVGGRRTTETSGSELVAMITGATQLPSSDE